jgi:hypothetical protein
VSLLQIATGAVPWACAVCGGGGMNQQAYIDTMIFLSALPLTLLGGAAWVVWKYNRAETPSEAAASQPSPSPGR